MPEVERPEFSKDAKPTERSYGKSVGGFRGIVQFWKGWCKARDGGEAIPPVVARIFFGQQKFAFDKGGKDMVRGKG